MLWCSMPELDLCLGLILIIVYGLYSLRNKLVNLADVYFFCRSWPLLIMLQYLCDSSSWSDLLTGPLSTPSIEILLCLLTFGILQSFKTFESVLLLMMAYVGQSLMLHSCDLVSFYVCLEMQNFCFLVLCGLQTNTQSNGFSVEASIKFLLLSAFSSGVLLFWFSTIYLYSGTTVLFFKTLSTDSVGHFETFQILLAMMFKLGAAPVHLWVVDIYGSVKRQLLMYISTAPKLSLFGFWVGSWHQVWTDYSIGLFVAFSMVLGSIGAYSQPALRALFAYSTINEIGLMLMAIETAGFHSLFQHLGIYIVTQLLLWNLSDKRLYSIIAVSLAGMPPLAGFFGKAWIFWHVASQQLIGLLALALFFTGLSLVYYLRVLRLFWTHPSGQSLRRIQYARPSVVGLSTSSLTGSLFSGTDMASLRIGLTSLCVIALCFAPIMLIKPFVI